MLYGKLKIEGDAKVKDVNKTELAGEYNILIGHYDFTLNCLVTIISKKSLEHFVSIEKLRYWIGDVFSESVRKQDGAYLIAPKNLGETDTKNQLSNVRNFYKKLTNTIKTELGKLQGPLDDIQRLDADSFLDDIQFSLIYLNQGLLDSILLDEHTPIVGKVSDIDVLLQQSITLKKNLLMPQYLQYWGLLTKHIEWAELSKEHIAGALMFMANNSTYAASRGVIAGSKTVLGIDKPLQYYRSQAQHPFFEFVNGHLIAELKRLTRQLQDAKNNVDGLTQAKDQRLAEYIAENEEQIAIKQKLLDYLATDEFINSSNIDRVLQAIEDIDDNYPNLDHYDRDIRRANTHLSKIQPIVEQRPEDNFKLLNNVEAAKEIVHALTDQVPDDLTFLDETRVEYETVREVLASVPAGLRTHNTAILTRYLERAYSDKNSTQTVELVTEELLKGAFGKQTKVADALARWRKRDSSKKVKVFDKVSLKAATFNNLYQAIFSRRKNTIEQVFSEPEKLVEHFNAEGVAASQENALVSIFRASRENPLIQISPKMLHLNDLLTKTSIKVGANNTEVNVTKDGLVVPAGNINLTEKLYINNLLSIFIASMTAIADLAQADLVYMRRQSFGFLSTTVSDTALSIRLSVGIEDSDTNAKAIKGGLICLAQFLNTVEKQIYSQDTAEQKEKKLIGYLKQLHFDGGNEFTEQHLITTMTRAFKRKCKLSGIADTVDIGQAEVALLKEMKKPAFTDQICANLEHIHINNLTAGWDWPEESTQAGSRLTRQNSRNFADSEYQLSNQSQIPANPDELYQSILKADLHMVATHSNVDVNKELPLVFSRALNLAVDYTTDGEKGRRLFGLLNIHKVLHDYLPFYIPTGGANDLDMPPNVYTTDGGQQALVVTCAVALRYYEVEDEFCYFELPSLLTKMSKIRKGHEPIPDKKALIFDPAPTLTTLEDQRAFVEFRADLANRIANFELLIIDLTNTSPDNFRAIDELVGDKEVIYLASGLKHMQLGLDKYQFGTVNLRLKDGDFKGAMEAALTKVQNASASPLRDRLVKQFLHFLPFWH